MNKKRLLSFILAVLITASLLASCGGDGQKNTSSSTATGQQQQPVNTQTNFAERLQTALHNATGTAVDFEVREKHKYSEVSSMEKALFAKWISDFSNADNPQFYYSMQRNPAATEPEILLFYDRGVFYVKDSSSKYRQLASLPQATGKIPFDGITALLGDDVTDDFRDAILTENEDGTVTAKIGIPLSASGEPFAEYLQLFGIEASGYAYGMDGDPCEVFLTMCMKDDSLLWYSIETIMAGTDRYGETYPVFYSVKADCRAVGDELSAILPDEEARAGYTEAEPEISEINAEEFLKRFERSGEKSDAAVYTEMITNSTATYDFLEGYWVKIPILTVTAIDLSKPRAPKVSITESRLDAMGMQHTKEMYYTDDTYYYSEDGTRFSVPYPAEEYLANVEASAAEKEAAGITSFFLTAEMLKTAVFTVNPDQSVSAVMEFDGTEQEKNIFHHIYSVYNDDLTEFNGVLHSAKLSVTLDRFNYLRSYTLTVTASIESNGTKALATYDIQYHFEYSETPREIDFPDDLAEWNFSSEGTENV